MSRILVKSGTIVTLDDAVGDLACGDVLIEDDRIVAIAPAIDAADARVLDASGRIVMPGFVNAHIHTWQTALRGVASDWTIPEYLHNMHAVLAPSFAPDDIKISNLAGALVQLDGGVTTIVDWNHNNPTPAHTDAAVEGLVESGIRALYLHGTPKPDPKPGQKHFSEVPHPRAEIERLKRGRFASNEGRLTLGMAILGPAYSTYEVCRADFALAREHDLVCSMHVGGGAMRTPDGFKRLMDEGLARNINLVHANNLSPDLIGRLLERGASVTVTPECELQMGFGDPMTGTVRRLGAMPSIGSDVESAMGADMFTNMRMALQYQRALDNQAVLDATGKAPERVSIPAREALAWATIGGARMAGLERRIGSLAPGKQADLVLLRASDLNLTPVLDPIHSIVFHAGPANVDTVLVAGQVVKERGRLVYGDLNRLQVGLTAVGRRVASGLGRVH
jgi:cytosine/adenosine deaminase-related metal-dependent hydrolase